MLYKFFQTAKKGARTVSLTKVALKKGGGFFGAARKAIKLYRREGLAGVKRGVQRLARANKKLSLEYYNAPGFDRTVSVPAPILLRRRILLIAELSIAQCTKYRVIQKRDMLRSLGVECTIVSWQDEQSCLSELATHSCVILYRVPGIKPVLCLIAEAKRLRIPTFWEVDDLVFNKKLLAEAKSLHGVDPATREGVLNGAQFYRAAMLACDGGIASTPGLRDSMLAAGVPSVYVVENALDSATLVAVVANAKPRDCEDDILRIVYGSGTTTHNADFEEAAQAILNVLKRYENVRFRLIGLLDLPAAFACYEHRIERIPLCDYKTYLQRLASADINIAPLEPGEFNDAKSNIKYLEASSVKLPTVCSPRSAFASVIQSGVNGFLCEGTEAWTQALTKLIETPALRRSVGQAAYEHVMQAYSQEYIAAHQVAPILHAEAPKKRIRALVVNVYYRPRAYGGATIVAEEITTQLTRHHQIDAYVFTTLPLDASPSYGVRRYEANGICVFGVGVPTVTEESLTFENPQMSAAFEEVVTAVQPDLVHFQSIQNIGVSIANVCNARGIPYVVTLHDAWWLCGRQFMVTREGNACQQATIDLAVCAGCVDNVSLNRYRQLLLNRTLHGAAMLLAPSPYFAEFFHANGFARDKVIVNKNGIRPPRVRARRKQSGPLRFGYAGGNVALKGVELIRQTFRELRDSSVSLTVVDNALNLGMKSYPSRFFAGVPLTTIVPAYTQETIDDFFESIDVLLFPTQAKESFGLIVREALVRDVWVITTDAGGAIEDIIPGRNGIIIPLNASVEDLRAAIRQTMAFYSSIPEGAPIKLEHGEISTFEDQATQIASLYRRIAQPLLTAPGQICVKDV